MENKYGALSKLMLDIAYKDGTTILNDVYFTPPFKIMKPFYENGLMRVVQMSASPGLMSGDKQEIDITVGENSVAELCSQSFEKIHKMENGQAERNINITLDENSLFIYNPLPTIPYARSAMSNRVKVNLSNSSSAFVYSDIMVCGRAARGEKFEYIYYNSLVSIFENNVLTYRDNTRFCPEKMNMNGLGMYEGYTHLLSMVICNVEIDDSEIFELFEDFETPYGITRNDKNYVVIKALGKTAQSLEKAADKVRKLVEDTKKIK